METIPQPPTPAPFTKSSLDMNQTIPVVYNACHGGFSLSKEALQQYQEKLAQAGLPTDRCPENHRHDPYLVEVVTSIGFKNGKYSDLKIRHIPIEYKDCYRIDEYDGSESVVCDPKDLVAYKLRKIDIDSMSDTEVRATLKELASLILEHKTYEDD